MNFDFTVLDTDRGVNPLPSRITVHPSQVCFSASTDPKSVTAFLKSRILKLVKLMKVDECCIV